jgi:valyl-tRNA synthetase
MAPFTPFITEEVYHRFLHAHEGFSSVHLAGWPAAPKAHPNAEEVGKAVVAVLAAVRKAKSEAKLSMKAPVKKIVIETKVDIKDAVDDLKATTAAEKIEFGKAETEIAPGLKVTISLRD